jgi:hypothetical protein
MIGVSPRRNNRNYSEFLADYFHTLPYFRSLAQAHALEGAGSGGGQIAIGNRGRQAQATPPRVYIKL